MARRNLGIFGVLGGVVGRLRSGVRGRSDGIFEGFLDEISDSLAEIVGVEGGGGGGDFFAVKMAIWELAQSGDERIDGLFAEEKTVFVGVDKITATAISEGNHWAASG